MKILYAIQGTGNGHLARATEIIPILKTLVETDVLVSGTQADLNVPFQIDYKLKGMSFIIGQNGGVDLMETAKKLPLKQLISDIRCLQVKKYDLVISDFEPVSAWACWLRGKECVGLSHQNAVLHPSAPKPDFNDLVGKLILKYYAPTNYKYGFNFKPSFPNIFPPVIRGDIRNAEPTRNSHYTVYLPAYSDQQILDVLSGIPDIEWQVFSKHSKTIYSALNVHFQPVSLDQFTKSFLNCAGLLCSAGFEGPAEAIYLGKKLCVVPMKKQYEQYCNAAFLKSMGVLVLDEFSISGEALRHWVKTEDAFHVRYPDMTAQILESIINKHCR